jgi:hypothetical protein
MYNFNIKMIELTICNWTARLKIAITPVCIERIELAIVARLSSDSIASTKRFSFISFLQKKT